MAKKKIELFIEIKNEKEFQSLLNANPEALICAEVYSQFAGSCTALDRLMTIIKFDWSDGKIILLKVPSDEVEALKRFRNDSEPIYLFIFRQKVTRVFRGVDSIQFAEVAKREILYHKKELEGLGIERVFYEINEPLPEEIEWFHRLSLKNNLEVSSQIERREARQAARKRHRAELMVPHLGIINFVLFWPHCKHAHPELYEQWDVNGIIMIGREELHLTKEKAEDLLYRGDAPINEGSMHALVSGTALAICFRLLDTGKHFVSLVRKILYEDVQEHDDTSEKTYATAFDHYKIYSKTKEQLLQMRYEEKEHKKQEEKKKKTRRLSEMKRLALQAFQDAIDAKRAKKEQKRLELLKAGDLVGLQKLKEQPSDEELSFAEPQPIEEPSSDSESSSRNGEDDEYFPPPGLLIPGFYAPPNDVAKANGLAILFPKIVEEYVTPQPEFLPPHVLVMLEAWKRHKAIKALTKHKNAVLHVGIFDASTPYDSVHIAYNVNEFDADIASQNAGFEDGLDSQLDTVGGAAVGISVLGRTTSAPLASTSINLWVEVTDNVKIAFMLSIDNDIPLLELMDLNPIHVSRDAVVGEEECSAMFPVDYADTKIDLIDFE